MFLLGGLGEEDPGGGYSPYQVLQPVEEAEGEGDPAGDLWQRKGNYPSTTTINIHPTQSSSFASGMGYSKTVFYGLFKDGGFGSP